MAPVTVLRVYAATTQISSARMTPSAVQQVIFCAMATAALVRAINPRAAQPAPRTVLQEYAAIPRLSVLRACAARKA